MSSQISLYGGRAIYAMLALVAMYGAFTVVLLMRRIREKQFSSTDAEEFLGNVRERLKQRQYDEIAEVCDSPPYWSKAVPQLILVALGKRAQPMVKLRRTLAETFEREVLAEMEYRISWITTIVKSAPMLGLLGTVLGMISAFAQLAVKQSTGASDVAGELGDAIGIALFTTALGLTVAIPLVIAGAMINIRLGRLQDSVQHWIGEFLEDFEVAVSGGKGSSN